MTLTNGCIARVKSLEPVTSTDPPSLALVTEQSAAGIELWVRQRIPAGSVVQLHAQGEFSLWKVFYSIPAGGGFYLSLEKLESDLWR